MTSPKPNARPRKRVKFSLAITALVVASALTFAAVLTLAVSLVGVGMQSAQYAAAQNRSDKALAVYSALQDHYEKQTVRYNADKKRLESQGFHSNGAWSPSGSYIEGLFFRFPTDVTLSDCKPGRECVVVEVASNSFVTCPTGIEVTYLTDDGQLFSGSSGYGISTNGSARIAAYPPPDSPDGVRLEKIVCS